MRASIAGKKNAVQIVLLLECFVLACSLLSCVDVSSGAGPSGNAASGKNAVSGSTHTASSGDLEWVTIEYGDGYDDGKARVEWGAALFDDPPTKANQKLAKVAAAINLTAGDEEVGEGKFIVPAFKELGFPDDEIVLFSYPKNDHNAEESVYGGEFSDSDYSFTIAHRIMGEGDNEFDLVLISLRGTQSDYESIVADWIKTWDVSKTDWNGFRTYSGYTGFADDVLRALDLYKSQQSEKINTSKTVYTVVGHSLGGAAANLVAAKLTDDGEIVYGFTFGALNSLQDAAPRSYENIWNVFHTLDTFGPYGKGVTGGAVLNYKPSNGGDTVMNRLGHVLVGSTNYLNVFVKGERWYTNHSMPGYFHTVSDHWGELREIDSMSDFDSGGVDVPVEDYPSNKEGQSEIGTVSDFSIEGSWKSVGDTGMGQLMPGVTVNFDGTHCNVYSPRDSYKLYTDSEGRLMLDCKNWLWGDVLTLSVEVVDNDHLILRSGPASAQLERTGPTVFNQAGAFDGLYANFDLPFVTVYYDFYRDNTVYVGLMGNDGSILVEGKGYYAYGGGMLQLSTDLDAAVESAGISLPGVSLGILGGFTCPAQLENGVLMLDGVTYYLISN